MSANGLDPADAAGTAAISGGDVPPIVRSGRVWALAAALAAAGCVGLADAPGGDDGDRDDGADAGAGPGVDDGGGGGDDDGDDGGPAPVPLECDDDPGAQSALWGDCSGDRWEPSNRLPDYSYAGYHTTGFRDLPTHPVSHTIDDDGDGDITAELRAAIALADGTSPFVILIPAGRWEVSNLIEVKKSHVVIRGAGPSETRIDITRGTGPENGGLGVMRSYTGPYFFAFDGPGSTETFNDTPVARVVADADRFAGATLALDDASALSAGDWIVVSHMDLDGSEPRAGDAVWRELFNGNPGSFADGDYQIRDGGPWYYARVVAVDGDEIELDRPVRWDVRPAEWRVEIYRVDPSEFIHECGLESLWIDFPEGVVDFKHHNAGLVHGGRTYASGEEVCIGGTCYLEYRNGFEAVGFHSAMNSWVRDVKITDFEGGLLLQGVHNTATRVELARDGETHTAHYGFDAGSFTHDNLFHDVIVRDMNVVHHFATSVGHGTVYSKIRKEGGNPPDLDMHKPATDSLWTEVSTDGNLRRLAGTSPSRKIKKHMTVWNVVATGGDDWNTTAPTWNGGGAINFVGIDTGALEPDTSDPTGAGGVPWIEEMTGGAVSPTNLYLGQLARRLAD
jgi:hypothetical protein